MNADHASNDDSLSQSLQEQIDIICDRFESAWTAGEQPNIEDYLEGSKDPHRASLFRELLLVELACRRRNGETPTRDEYRDRFPDNRGTVDDAFAEFEQSTDQTVAHTPTPAGRGLHIRCPHCNNPVELVADSPLEDLICTICGSHFSLAGDYSKTRTAPTISRIGHFELIERSGIGGFGTVWKARDNELDRSVLSSEYNVSGGEYLYGFSSDGLRLLVVDVEGNVHNYQIENGRAMVLEVVTTGVRKPLMAIDPDGTRFAIATEPSRDIYLYRVGQGEPIQRIRAPWPVRRLAWGATRKILAASTDDFGIYLWDIRDGSRLSACRGRTAASSRDGRFIRIWKRNTFEATIDVSDVTELAFSPDGQCLVGCGRGVFYMWQVGSWDQPQHTIGREVAGHGTAAFTPDSNLLAVSTSWWRFELFDLSSGQAIAALAPPIQFQEPLHGCRFSADGQLFVVAASGGTVFLWNTSSSTPRAVNWKF